MLDTKSTDCEYILTKLIALKLTTLEQEEHIIEEYIILSLNALAGFI